jgi:hypothetical protein
MFFSTSLYTFWLHEIFTGEGEKPEKELKKRQAGEFFPSPSFDCNLQHRKDLECMCNFSRSQRRRTLDFEEMWKHFSPEQKKKRGKDEGARVRLENVRDETVLGESLDCRTLRFFVMQIAFPSINSKPNSKLSPKYANSTFSLFICRLVAIVKNLRANIIIHHST